MLGKVNKHNPFCLILTVLHPILPIASITQDPDQPIPSMVRPQLHPITIQELITKQLLLRTLHARPFSSLFYLCFTMYIRVAACRCFLTFIFLFLITFPHSLSAVWSRTCLPFCCLCILCFHYWSFSTVIVSPQQSYMWFLPPLTPCVLLASNCRVVIKKTYEFTFQSV